MSSPFDRLPPLILVGFSSFQLFSTDNPAWGVMLALFWIWWVLADIRDEFKKP